MNNMAIAISEPESGRLEFKSATHGKLPENAWMSVSAFSNTDGGRILLELTMTERKLGFLQKN